MNFQTYKIFEIVNGFYYYMVSHIDDLDLNLTIAENWGATDELNPINQYINVVPGWDAVQIEKSSITPIDVISKNIPQDIKCMNISDEYVKLTQEAMQKLVKPKKEKVIKEKVVKDPKPKKEPKPKAKKSDIKIDLKETTLNMN